VSTTGELPEPEPASARPAIGSGVAGALPVLLAVPDPAVEAELLAALAGPTAGVAVVRRCVDLPDLLAAASAGTSLAAVVSSSLRRFDLDSVARLRRAGVAVVGVVGASVDAGAADAGAADAAEMRLRQIGVDHVVIRAGAASRSTGFVPAVVQAIHSAVSAGSRPVVEATGFGPIAGLPVTEPDLPAGAPRRLVAVWGPTGAPGRSLLAWQLAGEYAASGRSTLLVDADVYGGVVAQLAGLVDEAPGVVAACRAANAGALDVARLAGLARSIPLPSRDAAPLSVLTGIGRASRWPEVRPAALETLLAAARSLAEVVVVDCGFNLEDDEELSYDTTAPRRNGATLAALAAADEVLVVGSAEPIGLTRLIAGLDELRSALTDADVAPTVRVVVNRLRGTARQRRDVTAALERHAGVPPAALLPLDVDAADRAQREARLLLEVEPRSPLRLAIAGLVARPEQVEGRTRRRGRRLATRSG
jgi:MinD-like ATPase involved in chromosome partitioning or flagellar assembly